MHYAGRLHLIAGERDLEVRDSLAAEEYLRIRKLIAAYYSVALMDCGTGVTHNAMSGISGYYLAGTPTAAGTFQAVVPERFLDTRIRSLPGRTALCSSRWAGGTVFRRMRQRWCSICRW